MNAYARVFFLIFGDLWVYAMHAGLHMHGTCIAFWQKVCVHAFVEYMYETQCLLVELELSDVYVHMAVHTGVYTHAFTRAHTHICM